MKLYVVNRDGAKTHLDLRARTRPELAQKIGAKAISVNGDRYSIEEVKAEKSSDAAPLSAVIGSAIGLVGGMPGVLIGGVIGAALGSDADKKEGDDVEGFNRS